MNRFLKKALRSKRRKQSLYISVALHLIGIALIFYFVKPPPDPIEYAVHVDILPPPKRTMQPKKPEIKKVDTPTHSAISVAQVKNMPSRSGGLPVVTNTPRLAPPPLETITQLAPSPQSLLAETDLNTPEIGLGSGQGVDGVGLSKRGTGAGVAPKGRGSGQGILSNATKEGTQGELLLTPDTLITSQKDDIGDKLGSTIDESDGIVRGHIRLIRLKHQLSDWWQDPTAIPSLIKWLLANQPNITADMDYMGGALELTDKKIMDAPLVIMTGHDIAMSTKYSQLKNRNTQAARFTDVERAALRKYIIDHNGMLFFDYCGTGGNEVSFANIVETELREIFPEYPMETLKDTRHDIFQCYFKLKKTPVGGSFFWIQDTKAEMSSGDT